MRSFRAKPELASTRSSCRRATSARDSCEGHHSRITLVFNDAQTYKTYIQRVYPCRAAIGERILNAILPVRQCPGLGRNLALTAAASSRDWWRNNRMNLKAIDAIKGSRLAAWTGLGCLLLSTAALPTAEAEQYIISTVAGADPLPPPTPVQGVDLTIGDPRGVATDSSGNAYFTSDNYVFRLDQNGLATRIAGNPTAGSSGDGGPATSAHLASPAGIAVDGAGNLFVVDNFCVVRKISPSGIIVTVAGNGTQGYSGDGGPATSAQLNAPNGVAVDSAGNVFIADSPNFRVRKVSPGGIITTVAGNGTPGYSGDGGLAASAQLNYPTGVAVDGAGNLFIAEPTTSGSARFSKTGPSQQSQAMELLARPAMGGQPPARRWARRTAWR